MNETSVNKKKIWKPVLFYEFNLFASGKNSTKGYKYFSSLNVYHTSKTLNKKFNSLFQNIKYMKKIKVPSAMALLNTQGIVKKFKSLNKTTACYQNVLSYFLSRGKQRSLALNDLEKRVFRNAKFISEGLVKKGTNLQGIKLQKNLELLKVVCNLYSWQNDGEQFLQAIKNLKNLKFIFLSLPSFSGKELDNLFETFTHLKQLQKIQLSVYELKPFKDCFGENFKIKKIAIDFYRGTSEVSSLLKTLTKVQDIQEITLTSNISQISEWCFDKIKSLEEPLLNLGISLEAIDNSSIQEKSIISDKPWYTLKITPLTFSYLKKDNSYVQKTFNK